MVVLDSSVIIDHLRLKKGPESLFERFATADEALAVSTITITELFSGRSTLIEEERKVVEFILYGSELRLLEFSSSIARLAGEIRRDTLPKITLADAGIAGTAISYNASLATLNIKDFINIAGLNLFNSNIHL